MGNIGLLKRALPFFGTFALGLFIASFFVNIGGPRMGHRESGKCRHEVQQLREENMRLQLELDAMHENHLAADGLPLFESEDFESPSVDEPVLPPPPAPRTVKPRSVHIK